jgi:hypothetical protein
MTYNAPGPVNIFDRAIPLMGHLSSALRQVAFRRSIPGPLASLVNLIRNTWDGELLCFEASL